MSYENLLLDISGNIGLLTLNQPRRLNALDEAMRQEILRAVDALADDDNVRALIICGAGEKAFIAGADINEFAARTPEEQAAVYARRRVYEAVAEFPKPVIAAIHGYCYGGGSELALACDLRVADRTARFGQFEIRLGLVPSAGGTQRLARLVGYGQALRIAMTGDEIDAEEAYRIGLCEFLVDEGEHVAMARRLAERMVRWSPVALSCIKESVRQAAELPLSQGIALEKELFLRVFASEDGQEGVRAFVEKRKPEFKGR